MVDQHDPRPLDRQVGVVFLQLYVQQLGQRAR